MYLQKYKSVDDLFAVERKSRRDEFCEDYTRLVPINNLGVGLALDVGSQGTGMKRH